MKIIKHDRFQSVPQGVDKHTDMVRVVVDMSNREFNVFRGRLLSEEAPVHANNIRNTPSCSKCGASDEPVLCPTCQAMEMAR